MIRILPVAAIGLLASGAFAAPPAGSVALHEALYGTGLRFGMTEADVEKTLHAHIKHGQPHYYDEFTIPDGKYQGLSATYLFQFTSSGKLTAINLFVKEPGDSSEQEIFSALLSGFIKQYGEPVAVEHSRREGGTTVSMDVWTTPDTEISYELGPSSYMKGTTALILAQPRVTAADAVTVPSKALSGLAQDSEVKAVWAGLPIAVIRRSPDELRKLAMAGNDASESPIRAQSSTFVTLTTYGRSLSEANALPHPEYRSIQPEIGVFIDVDTAVGCTLEFLDLSKDSTANMPGAGFGFYDPCHGDVFDLAGRTLRTKYGSAPLLIPKYHFEPNGDLVIGK